jgi:hypothetical protein
VSDAEVWSTQFFLRKVTTFVRFEVFTAVTMKNAVFWDVAPCRYCVNLRFGGTYRLHLQCIKIRDRGTSVSRWLQTEPPVENTQLYKEQEGRESELHGKSIERRGEGSVEMGQQVAGKTIFLLYLPLPKHKTDNYNWPNIKLILHMFLFFPLQPLVRVSFSLLRRFTIWHRKMQ